MHYISSPQTCNTTPKTVTIKNEQYLPIACEHILYDTDDTLNPSLL